MSRMKVIKVLLVIFISFQILLSARLYWFASCVIPTYSMSPTLIEGDYIITNLQIPGRRILKKNTDGHFDVYRKKGTRPINKGDVVIFNFPYAENKNKMVLSMQQFYCKRCVALPGTMYYWNGGDRIHSIYLPKKGDYIHIDSTNYYNYYKCIEYETDEPMKLKNGQIFLADSLLTSYTFQHNYYFMRGDYTKNSYDSRYWGLLPEDFILGVGHFIWLSKDKNTGEIRWKRMFTRI